MTTQEMQNNLLTLITQSNLDKLFKLGRTKIQEKKLPYSVSFRLKLNNPYTFLEFQMIEKKKGPRFCIKFLKTIPKELRKIMLEMGGAPDNSNTLMEFDYDGLNGTLAENLKKLYKTLLTPAMIELCQAENYKPLKIILAQEQAEK